MFLKANKTFSENKSKQMKLKMIYEKKATRQINNITNIFQHKGTFKLQQHFDR